MREGLGRRLLRCFRPCAAVACMALCQPGSAQNVTVLSNMDCAFWLQTSREAEGAHLWLMGYLSGLNEAWPQFKKPEDPDDPLRLIVQWPGRPLAR